MKLLYFIIIIMLTNFFPSTHIYAVDKIEQSIPKISVNILIVPEIEACRPDGYTNYSSENYFCEPLTAKDIERWEQTGQITEKYTIPPSVISLGPRLSETLYAYSLLPLTGPKTRLCAIFVFKWNSPQNGMVSLNRYSTQGNIPNGEWHAELKKVTYWIHQERADALLPAYGCNWKLQIDGKTWLFNTAR